VSRESDIEFIRAKVELIEKYFNNDAGHELREKWSEWLKLVPTYDIWPSQSSVYADRELDRLIEYEEVSNSAFTEAEAKRLFRELRERFGYSRLGGSPAQVARRVLKRKQIKDEEEYYMVKDLLNNAYPKAAALLSKEQLQQLWQTYEGYSSR
jgi:hypothetical protein